MGGVTFIQFYFGFLDFVLLCKAPNSITLPLNENIPYYVTQSYFRPHTGSLTFT